MKLKLPSYHLLLFADPSNPDNAPIAFSAKATATHNEPQFQPYTPKPWLPEMFSEVTLVLCNKNFLLKTIHEIDPGLNIDTVISQVLPGMDTKQLYASIDLSDGANSMTITQKHIVDPYLEKWRSKLQKVTHCCLLKTDLQEILDHPENIAAFWKVITNNRHNIVPVSINAERLTHKQKQSKQLIMGATIVLGILMLFNGINTILLNRLSTVQTQSGQSQELIQQLNTQKESIDHQLVQLKSLGFTQSTELVALTHSLVQDVPGSIQISELKVKPVEVKDTGREIKFDYEKDRVIIKGITQSSNDLNDWMNTLKALPVVDDLDLSYQFEKQQGKFQLMLKINA